MSLPSLLKIECIVNSHRQLRLTSCFQSAPELWLKIKGVIRISEYPEQHIPENDGRGYEPFPNNGLKVYGRKRVHFEKITFDFPYDEMRERFREELHRGNPVVVSLRSAPLNPWHGYVVCEEVGGDFSLFSKSSPPNSVTIKSLLNLHLTTQEKVDCLFMTRPKDQ